MQYSYIAFLLVRGTHACGQRRVQLLLIYPLCNWGEAHLERS